MGRLRTNPNAASEILLSDVFEINPQDKKGLWNKKIFKNSNPIHIEIGMGKGNFIIQQAVKNPLINFVGIEKYPTVILKAINKCESLENPAPNLRFVSFDAQNIDLLFSSNEISKIFLNFSDPWPKKRHIKKRLTYPKLFDKYMDILKFGMNVEIKTDNWSLYNYSLNEIKLRKDSKVLYNTEDLYSELELSFNKNNIQTEYEAKFVLENKQIYKIITSNIKNLK